MNHRRVVLVLSLVALSSPTLAADVVLVAAGQPRAQVVTADNAPAVVAAAAADFVRVLQRMTGAALPLVTESRSDATRPRVLIGAVKPPAGLDVDPGRITGDEAWAGYQLVCGQNVLVLRGHTPVGTANAVCGFLQDQLGVRWFLPGEAFEVVPRRDTVTVPELRQQQVPSFVCRLASASGTGGFTAWAHHNRWDFGRGGWAVPYAAGFTHWMYAVYPPSKYGKSHPDIYPLLHGQRAIPTKDGDQLAQPCTSNPDTIRIAVETINTYLDAHPECHTYPFSINDNNTWCECERCRAQDVERPLYRGRRIYSDRWFTFVNAVARGVRAKHPRAFIGCFAYAGVELPPLKIERMEPNVFVNLTQDTAQYYDPAYRQVDYDLIRAWQAKCGQVGKYDYYGLGALAPRYFPHLLAADLKAVHAMGVRAFHSELYPYWANMGPLLYVASRLLWDVRLEPDALLAEFYAAFGPAGGEVRAFYETHEAAWLSQRQGEWFGGIGSAAQQLDGYTPAQVSAAAEHLQRAAALADSDAVKARVALIARGYGYADLLLRGWTGARAASRAAVRNADEAKALAANLTALLTPLDREEQAWRDGVLADPLADRWYLDGARPGIRAQWRSTVQAALTDGLHALSTWRQTNTGGPAPAYLQDLEARLTANPRVRLLWLALQGKLKLGPNLLPNPGFESARAGQPGPTGPDWQSAGVAAGWSTWQEDAANGVFYLDGAVKRAGQVAGAFRGGTCLCYLTTLPIATGRSYLAEVWARSPVVRQGTAVTLEVRWRDAAGRWFTGAADLRVETRRADVWEHLVIPFTTPPGAAQTVVLLVGYGIQKDDVVRFDDAYVGEAEQPAG